MRNRHRLHRFLLVAVVIGLLSAPTVSLTAQSAAGVAPRELVSAQGAVPGDLGPSEVYIGTPWTGEPGITETVAEIVERARAEEEQATQTPRVRKPVGVKTEPKQENPDASALPQWPPLSEVEAERAEAPSTAFTVSTNFLGVRLSESGAIPPDTNGAVGPT